MSTLYSDQSILDTSYQLTDSHPALPMNQMYGVEFSCLSHPMASVRGCVQQEVEWGMILSCAEECAKNAGRGAISERGNQNHHTSLGQMYDDFGSCCTVSYPHSGTK
jgi:hypothetical protein